MKRLKLSTKITLNYAIIFTTVLLLINISVYFTTQIYNTFNARYEVEEIKDYLVSDIEKNEDNFENLFNTVNIAPPFYVVIKSPKTEILSSSNFSVSYKDGELSLIKMNIDEKITTDKVFYKEDKILLENGIYELIVIKDLSIFSFLNTVTLVNLVIVSVLGIFISYMIGNYMAKESFAPIIEMTKSASKIGAENIHDRIIEPEVDDELKELAVTFNALLERLDEAYMKQSRFVADASHELRTPITVIKGYVDMLDRWGKDNEEVLNESISSIQNEVANMSELVENLLFIARSDKNDKKIEKENFDLYELLTEIIKEYKLSYKERYFELYGKSTEVYQNKRLIKQLFRIFIDNSIKFTEKEDSIRLYLESTKTSYSVIIEDEGEGIPKEDLDKIFLRFYTVDKARTKGKHGSGLGLSIARSIVDAHNGEITIKSNLDVGTVIKVEFPI